jgi:dipeptidyl aminopeptidase/acylaminoacyl peptidase
MKNYMRKCFVLSIVLIVAMAISYGAVKTIVKKKPIGVYDSLKWKSIRGGKLSDNGVWFGYSLVPNYGKSKTIIKNIKTGKEHKFDVGKISSYFGNKIEFSADSKWAAFYVHPDKKRGKKGYKKIILLNLKTGKKREYEKVGNFSFSKDNPNWIAILRVNDSVKKGKNKGKGSDLILINLKNNNIFNIGNVSDYSFNKRGDYFTYLIDADDMIGNGVYLRNLKTGVIKTLDSDKAKYKSVKWDRKKDYLTVLKGKESKEYKDKVYSILGFKFIKGKDNPKKYSIVKEKIKNFPKDIEISPHRTPYWSEIYNAIVFGIYKPDKKEDKDKKDAKKIKNMKNSEKKVEKGAKQEKTDKNIKKEKAKKDTLLKDLKLPSLIIWHYNDKKLQSMQKLEYGKDKNYSYPCIYNFDKNRFVRIADDNIRDIVFSSKKRVAIGYDNSKYELEGNLSGKRYSDIYSIDVLTGKRKLILKKIRWSFSPSYDGTYLLYYKNGDFYTISMITGKSYNITKNIPSTFINTEDDHNVKNPPVYQYGFGWSKDGKYLLLTDGWDIWKTDKFGKKHMNLTINGKKEGIRYRYPFVLDKDFSGFDNNKPLFVSMYGEWTKKSGIVKLNLKKPKNKKIVLFGDANYSGLMKPKKSNIYIYRYETYKDYPDYYSTDFNFKTKKKITDANPQQKQCLWGAGKMLINYKNSEGKKLQGALFLPANYKKGEKYPLIVYIYEKLSGYLNRYQIPREFGFSVSRYTSNGYAVLMPDIVFKVNDPGRSSVDCIKAAVKAAIATGIVNKDKIGIHGHSWGGYQTAYIITQTDMFRAAAAGAPLTNLISMYSSIYWNSGSCNQPIFESSQGRFKGGYWDYFDAYTRNSPVHNVKKVKTPLLLLHNDKDGAVDWNQGIEYYNTLRRLHKFVIMLEYIGENHGLRKKENRIDYGIRMKEYFDYFLKDKPAPCWMKKGVPYLKLKKYLKKRKKIIDKM